jgi:hypothetical protein
MSSVRKGVLWLLVATLAEVPPAVSSAYSLTCTFSLIAITSQVFIIMNLNSIVVFFSIC